MSYKYHKNTNTQHIISESNRLKVKAGLEFSETILDLLEQLLDTGLIKGIQKEVHFSHEGLSYEKQYLANYLVETYDSKIIVVRSSTSFRNDRAKIGFYDLLGISEYGKIGKRIVASIYLVPDSELTNKTFLGIRKRVENKEYFCPASHLFCLTEFVDFLSEYKYNQEFEGLVETNTEAATQYNSLNNNVEKGSYLGKQGNRLETELVELLSTTEQLNHFKSGQIVVDPMFKKIISKICQHEKILKENILLINATNSVTLLKSGGSAKTDIILRLLLSNGNTTVSTLSIKNTKAKVVSCHDYKASDFIRVLDCEDSKFAEYLMLFQKFPTHKDFEQNMHASQSISEFLELMKSYGVKLSEWALTGAHDELNLVDPKIQISQYIFISNWETEKNSFYSSDEYLRIIRKEKMNKFGVPFGWTYPSKCRGQRIQLKLPIVL